MNSFYRVFLKSTLIVLPLALALSAVTSWTADTKRTLLGDWVLNQEETEKLRPKRRKTKVNRRGFGILPNIGGGSPSGNPTVAAGTAKLPVVLSCVKMTLSKSDDVVTMSCDEAKTRQFLLGNEHGRIAAYKPHRLTERYRATSRRVSHEFKYDKKKDRIVVKVSIRPVKRASEKHILVFDRVS